MGHVTEAQPRNKEQKESQVGIAFDRAVMKDGSAMQMPMSIQAIIGEQNNNQNNPGGGNSDATLPAAAPAPPPQAAPGREWPGPPPLPHHRRAATTCPVMLRREELAPSDYSADRGRGGNL